MMTERIRKIYERIMDPGNRYTQRGFREYPKIQMEEKVLKYESYLKTEGIPEVIREAMALEHLLKNREILIFEDELIVGAKALKEYDKNFIKKVEEFYKERSENHKLFKILTSEERVAKDTGLSILGARHYIVDFEGVLNKGIKGILAEVNEQKGNTRNKEEEDFLTACEVVLNAVLNFAKRYSDKAFEMAQNCKDVKRKKELLEISEILKKVPENPAESFREALQSIWFIYLLCPDGFGRLDKYLYPFYKRDVERGIIDYQGGLELIENLFLKTAELVGVLNYGIFNITIGGLCRGESLENEITLMCLEAVEDLRLINPAVSLRISSKTSKGLLRRACDVLKRQTGYPVFYNDDIIIPMLQDLGISQEDAEDYAVTGCAEVVIPGRSNMWAGGGYVNVLKSLELSLNSGVSFIERKKVGLATKPVSEIEDFDDLLKVFKEQLDYAIDLLASMINKLDEIIGEVPNPLISVFMSDCIENKKDFNRGGTRYNFTSCYALGISNAADSLYAIKKAVFDHKIIKLYDLVAVLKNNFQENENIRRFLFECEKFGNDSDEVDFLAREITHHFLDGLKRYKNPRDGGFIGGAISWLSYRTLGRKTGASPDGRLAGEFLADSFNPARGRAQRGPTALLNSILKIDHRRAAGILVSTLEFSSDILKNEEGLFSLLVLIKTFFELGGTQLQVNLLDRDELIKAKKEPEKYRHIIVRVAGFSAYFVTLSEDVQDDIISRF